MTAPVGWRNPLRRPEPPDLVQQALDALPGTPGEIADRLVAMGIKGDPGSGEACALAAYLKQQIPGSCDLIVDRNQVMWWDEVWPLSAAAQRFACCFDFFEYPDLIA